MRGRGQEGDALWSCDERGADASSLTFVQRRSADGVVVRMR